MATGDTRGIMCSYNEVNGVPACMSPFLRGTPKSSFLRQFPNDSDKPRTATGNVATKAS